MAVVDVASPTDRLVPELEPHLVHVKQLRDLAKWEPRPLRKRGEPPRKARAVLGQLVHCRLQHALEHPPEDTLRAGEWTLKERCLPHHWVWERRALHFPLEIRCKKVFQRVEPTKEFVQHQHRWSVRCQRPLVLFSSGEPQPEERVLAHQFATPATVKTLVRPLESPYARATAAGDDTEALGAPPLVKDPEPLEEPSQVAELCRKFKRV